MFLPTVREDICFFKSPDSFQASVLQGEYDNGDRPSTSN